MPILSDLEKAWGLEQYIYVQYKQKLHYSLCFQKLYATAVSNDDVKG